MHMPGGHGQLMVRRRGHDARPSEKVGGGVVKIFISLDVVEGNVYGYVQILVCIMHFSHRISKLVRKRAVHDHER